MAQPISVLLFNLGGPTTLEAVEPFLVRLFSDRDIIELPFGRSLQPGLARAIARLRGPSVRRNYSQIGGGSPQLRITRGQALLLETRLNAARLSREASFRVFVSMRYSSPSIDEALCEIVAAGIRRVITLPLFPHCSQATTGSWQHELERTLESPVWKTAGLEISGIERYPAETYYLDALADTVRSALERFSADTRNRVVILFSAHGVPEKFVKRGDPYVAEIEATRWGVWKRLRLPNPQVLGYQSRTGPVRWVGPGTDELIRQLGEEGVRGILVVPLSFVSDHIETLYEVDILFAELARRAGIVEFHRTEALNGHPWFIEALAQLVERHVGLRPRVEREEPSAIPA